MDTSKNFVYFRTDKSIDEQTIVINKEQADNLLLMLEGSNIDDIELGINIMNKVEENSHYNHIIQKLITLNKGWFKFGSGVYCSIGKYVW